MTVSIEDLGRQCRNVLRRCEFALAGLADSPPDYDFEQGLLHVKSLADSRPDSLSHESQALLLITLIRLAQTRYAEVGKADFWKQLDEAVNEVLSKRAISDDWTSAAQNKQGYLSERFQHALKKFGFHVPLTDESGHGRISPILFHAAIPANSLSKLFAFIGRQLDDTASCDVADFDAASIAHLVPDDAPMHKNVRQLLRSGWEAVEEIWKPLVEVVRAGRYGDESSVSKALQELPGHFDEERVREELNATSWESGPPVVGRTLILPRLTYQRDRGRVNLWMPSKPPADGLDWHASGEGFSARLARPLTTLRGTITPCASGFPGLFFNFVSGQLIDGKRIDDFGLKPGEHILLIDGVPEESGDWGRERLDWAYFASGNWNAWRINVREGEKWSITIAGQTHSVPVAGKPAPQAWMPNAITTVIGDTGEVIPVYSSPPSVTVNRNCNARLFRRVTEGNKVRLSVADYQLTAGSEQLLSEAIEPGAYLLRKHGGVCATLAQFVVLPGVCEPTIEYTTDHTRVSIRVEADRRFGTLKSPAKTIYADGAWHISADTVKPELEAEWAWEHPRRGNFGLSWPVRGVRWRIRDDQSVQPWTRDPVWLPRSITRDVVLEIHSPDDTCPLVNCRLPEKSSTDNQAKEQGFRTAEQGLYSISSGLPAVTVGWAGREWTAIRWLDGPVLTNFSVSSVGEVLRVGWQVPVEFLNLRVFVWKPLEPAATPQSFVVQTGARQLEIPWRVVGGAFAGVALGVLPVGLGAAAPKLASEAGHPDFPMTKLVHQTNSMNIATFVGLADELTRMVFTRTTAPAGYIGKRLSELADHDRLIPDVVRTYASKIPAHAAVIREELLSGLATTERPKRVSIQEHTEKSIPTQTAGSLSSAVPKRPALQVITRTHADAETAEARKLIGFRKRLGWLAEFRREGARRYAYEVGEVKPREFRDFLRSQADGVSAFCLENGLGDPAAFCVARTGSGVLQLLSRYTGWDRCRWTFDAGTDEPRMVWHAALGLCDVEACFRASNGEKTSRWRWRSETARWSIPSDDGPSQDVLGHFLGIATSDAKLESGSLASQMNNWGLLDPDSPRVPVDDDDVQCLFRTLSDFTDIRLAAIETLARNRSRYGSFESYFDCSWAVDEERMTAWMIALADAMTRHCHESPNAKQRARADELVKLDPAGLFARCFKARPELMLRVGALAELTCHLFLRGGLSCHARYFTDFFTRK